MPLDSKGNFHLHPGAARMHDAAPKAPPIAAVKKAPVAGKGPESEGEAKGHIELHKTETGYKTIHHPTGEEKHHADAHAAHQAEDEHFGEASAEREGGEASGASGAVDDEY